jgi:hypothetical protein
MHAGWVVPAGIATGKFPFRNIFGNTETRATYEVAAGGAGARVNARTSLHATRAGDYLRRQFVRIQKHYPEKYTQPEKATLHRQTSPEKPARK